MAKPFLWFGPATVAELREQLNAVGSARLEIHDDGRDATIVVVPEDADGARGQPLRPLNESHWCPPDC